MRIVPDTSVIVDGRITLLVESGEVDSLEIVVPNAVVAELEAQANRGQESGLAGLDELAKLQDMAKAGQVKVRYIGPRPSLEAIELAKSGEIDAMVRDVAMSERATLMTSDRVQAAVAGALGLAYEYIRPIVEKEPDLTQLELSKFFEPDIMSVHLKAGVVPFAKRGTLKDLRYEPIGQKIIEHRYLSRMSNELIESARRDPRSFIELERHGVTVLQLGPMRIVIARPPFSDAIEITAVRPIKRLTFEEYALAEPIQERLRDKARGVLIAGPPGSGKSTLAQAVAEWLDGQGRVVKTMEQPRDLQTKDSITQYAPLEKQMALTAEIILLVRPDHVVYDEVRKTSDFETFADMRLAGVGLIGVTHSNRAIDAIQRLIGRVELGMIPQIVDTVVFVERGEIAQIVELQFTVRVPSGMVEADLARPVIVVQEFPTKRELFEIYTYGEQVVVMPIERGGPQRKAGAHKLAEDQLLHVLRRHVTGDLKIDVVSASKAVVYAEQDEIGRLIGRGGETIKQLEREVGLSLDVKPFEAKHRDTPRETSHGKRNNALITPKVVRSKKNLVLSLPPEYADLDVEVLIEDEPVLLAHVSRKGELRVKRESPAGEEIIGAHERGLRLQVRV